jgi:putative ABC transport system permease protein
MDQILEAVQYAQPRFALILFSVFSAIGLVLVSVGVYSVISYTVTQQRHEIGIRMAVGASARDVGLLVLMSALRLIFIGLGIGELLGVLLSRFLANQIWGVSWYDPLTQGGGIVLLTLVGVAASYVPSIRAMRVDPAVSLRDE